MKRLCRRLITSVGVMDCDGQAQTAQTVGPVGLAVFLDLAVSLNYINRLALFCLGLSDDNIARVRFEPKAVWMVWTLDCDLWPVTKLTPAASTRNHILGKRATFGYKSYQSLEFSMQL